MLLVTVLWRRIDGARCGSGEARLPPAVPVNRNSPLQPAGTVARDTPDQAAARPQTERDHPAAERPAGSLVTRHGKGRPENNSRTDGLGGIKYLLFHKFGEKLGLGGGRESAHYCRVIALPRDTGMRNLANFMLTQFKKFWVG